MTRYTYTVIYEPEGSNIDITDFVQSPIIFSITGSDQTKSAKLRLNATKGQFITQSTTRVANIAATGTVTCNGVLEDDTVTVNGLIYTGVDGTKSNNTQFDISGDDTATAIDLADSITQDVRTGTTLDQTALATANVVTITASVGGTGGNAITLVSSTAARLLTSGGTLTGGAVISTPTPIIDFFDTIEITTTIDTIITTETYEVLRLKPMAFAGPGNILEVEMLGLENELDRTLFAKQFRFASGFTVARDIIDFHNDLDSRGSLQPEVSGQDADFIDGGGNELPKVTASDYMFNISEIATYEAERKVLDKMGGTVAALGAGDFFELYFRTDPNNKKNLLFEAFSSGNPPRQQVDPAGGDTTFDPAKAVTITDTESINPAEEEGGLDAPRGTVTITWGAVGFGSNPVNISQFSGDLQAFNLIPDHIASEFYPFEDFAKLTGSGTSDDGKVYQVSNEDGTTTTPPGSDWDEIAFASFTTVTVYSPWTDTRIDEWRNSGSNPLPTVNGTETLFNRRGCWDCNLVIDDGINNMLPADIRSNTDAYNLNYKYLNAFGGQYRGFRVLVDSLSAAAQGTVTCASVAVNDTVTVNGLVYTAVSGTPSSIQFDQSGDDITTAVSLASAITNDTRDGTTLDQTATSNADVVTIIATVGGALGNTITLVSSSGTRLAVSGPTLTFPAAGVFSGVDKFNNPFANNLAEWNGSEWVVKKVFNDNEYCSVIGEGDVYRLLSGTWTNLSGSPNENHCFHIYDSIVNDQGFNNTTGFGATSAIQVTYKIPNGLTENLAPGFNQDPDYYRYGVWLDLTFPLANNTFNSVTTIGELYGNNSTKKEPVTYDTNNMHLTHSGKVGFNNDEAEERGPNTAIEFQALFTVLAGVDGNGGQAAEGEFEFRCACYDTEDNVLIQDFIIPFNNLWTQISLPLTNFQIYRARTGLALKNLGTNIQLNALEITNVFRWENLKRVSIQWNESYDDQGRYDPVGKRPFNMTVNGTVALTTVALGGLNASLTIDAFRFAKPLLSVSPPDTERSLQPQAFEEPLIFNKRQLDQANQGNLEIEQFPIFRFKITTNGRNDIQFGDSFFLENKFLVNTAEKPDGSGGFVPNTVKLVAKKITHQITKSPTGPGGYLITIDGVRRLES